MVDDQLKKNSNFCELLLQTIRSCLCCHEGETLGANTPACKCLIRWILACGLFALLLHLVFVCFSPSSPSLPLSLHPILLTLLFFHTADVTQKTATMAIHSEEPATVSNCSLDSQLHVGARRHSSSNGATRTKTSRCDYSWNPPTPPCTHNFNAADGAFWHFGARGWGGGGVIVGWRSDLSPKCQAHQKERLSSSPTRRRSRRKKISPLQQPSHSVACPLIHSSILRVDFMLLGRCLSVRYIRKDEECDVRSRILRLQFTFLSYLKQGGGGQKHNV